MAYCSIVKAFDFNDPDTDGPLDVFEILTMGSEVA